MTFWHFFEILLDGVLAFSEFSQMKTFLFFNHCSVLFYMIRGDFAKFNYRIASIILFPFSMALNTRVGPQNSVLYHSRGRVFCVSYE